MHPRARSSAVIASLLIAFVILACGAFERPQPTETLAPPTVTEPPTATQPPPTDTPTLAPATPTLIYIRADLIYMLTIFQTFKMGDNVRGLAFTPEGDILAAAGGNSGDYDIHLWDVAKGKITNVLTGHTNIVWDVAFSPDGKFLASVSSDKTAQIRDSVTGDVVKTLDMPGETVKVSFSPDGQTLAVGGVDASGGQRGNAAIWTYSVGSWEPVLKYPERINITALAFSPKGGTLIGGGTSRNVQVWRTADAARQFTLAHEHQVLSAAISPDGLTAATGTCIRVVNSDCMEGGIWLWNLTTGTRTMKIGGFPDFVSALAFTPDGSTLIAGSRDGTLRVFNTTAYEQIYISTLPGGIDALAISKDGGLLATGGQSGDVNLWKILYVP